MPTTSRCIIYHWKNEVKVIASATPTELNYANFERMQIKFNVAPDNGVTIKLDSASFHIDPYFIIVISDYSDRTHTHTDTVSI